jgi:hypothetical protein
MTLTEVLMASVVFGLAINASAQLWGRSVAWSRGVENRQEALQRLEIDLVRQEQAWRQSGPLTAQADCPPEGVWLVAQAIPAGGAEAIERRRLFVPAAHGLCLPPVEPPSDAGSEP